MLSMVPIKASPGVAASYYTKGDYYTKDADAPSEWSGKGALALGLEGSVERGAFTAILEGNLPDGHRPAWVESGKEHRPGWDLTFSAPKGVSILATVGEDNRLVEAHERAVAEALKFVESYAFVRERLEDGSYSYRATDNIIAARFTEFFSRALDPQLHTHSVVANLTYDAKRTGWYALESYPLFKMKMAAGQIYRNALAHDAVKLGYDIETQADTGLFDIPGIPKELLSLYSQRREAIEKYAAEHGWASARDFARATLFTRPNKESATHDDVLLDLDARAGEHLKPLLVLIDKSYLNLEDQQRIDPKTRQSEAIEAARHALNHLSNREAVFEEGHILLEALKVSVGKVEKHDIEAALKSFTGAEKIIRTAFQTGGKWQFHGRTIERSTGWEKKLTGQLLAHRRKVRPLASEARIRQATESFSLTSEQEKAAHFVLSTRDRVVSVAGVAGAGKSHLVKAIKAATTSRHHLALAPTATAAIDLGKSVGIEAQTLTGFLQSGGHHVSHKSILFVDEASMSSTRQAARLLDIAVKRKARIVFIGDTKQLEAVEQGKPFGLLLEQGLRSVKLDTSFRQKNAAIQSLVKLARDGKITDAFNALGSRIKSFEQDELVHKVAEAWLSNKHRSKIAIAALENASRIGINAAVRKGLQKEGIIASHDHNFTVLSSKGLTPQQLRYTDYYKPGNVVIFHTGNKALKLPPETRLDVVKADDRDIVARDRETGERIRFDPKRLRKDGMTLYEEQDRKLAEGDRIQWRKNLKSPDKKRSHLLQNGHTGTIEKIDGNKATIRFDHHLRKTIDLEKHPFWDHGYALTVYKQQGKTTPVNWLVADTTRSGNISQTAFYVSLSRAEHSVRLFTNDRDGLERAIKLNPGGKTSALEGRGLIQNLRSPEIEAQQNRIERFVDRLPDRVRATVNDFLDWRDSLGDRSKRPDVWRQAARGSSRQQSHRPEHQQLYEKTAARQAEAAREEKALQTSR